MDSVVQGEIETGDVLELSLDGEPRGDSVTAMVLLATDEAMILDRCDDSTPFVVRLDELGSYRRFEPAP